MKKIISILILSLFLFEKQYAQPDDEYYAKQNSLDLAYIPNTIKSNIAIGRGYDMTDPWYPVIADASPFLVQNTNFQLKLKQISSKNYKINTSIPPNPASNDYHMSYQDNVDERTVAEFFHAELKAGGLSWDIEASAEYVKTRYDLSQGIRFVLENTSTMPTSVEINTDWKTAPVTEISPLNDITKWKLFKQKYGSHYVTSFTYGFRIEIIAFGNKSVQDSKVKLNLAFNSWLASGKFDASMSENIKQSNANIEIKIFCNEIKNTTTGSNLPFIITGLPQVLTFLDQLKEGVIQITPAPITISVKSYFASVCSKYQNSCKLWENKVVPADSNAVPKGTILSWVPPSQNIRIIAGQTVIIAPIGGWAVCDKRNHDLDPRIPNLSEKFLMGAADASQIGLEGGNATHNHGGVTGTAFANSDGYHVDGDKSKSPQASGLAHTHQIASADNLPPFRKVIYIIKL